MKESTENLKLIEEMIASAKGNIKEGSVFYLIWGWLVLIAAMLNYVLLNVVTTPYHWFPWAILMPLGGIISMIVGNRKKSKQNVKTYVDRAMGFLWGGFGATLLAVLVAMPKIGPTVAYPMMIFLYGLGTFVSGGILNFKPLKLGGIACWFIGSVAVYVEFSNQLLLLALVIVVSYLIPGHLLAAKKEN